jgi:O-antigen ligase
MYTEKLAGSALPVNLQDRLDIWRFYLREILSDPSTFFFGHSAPPDRALWPSAHNYYLDVTYNFGVLAILVLVGLAVFTLVRLYQHRRLVLASSTMTGLALVVLFLILPDSLIKVSLRQPYPGIFAFFLWGLLLARIDLLQTADAESRRQIEESANEAPSLSAGNRTGS